MNQIASFICVLSFLFLAVQAEEKSLLHDAVGALVVSEEAVEAIYIQAIEKSLIDHSYVQVGAPWNSNEAGDTASYFAGLNVIEEPKILFSSEKSLNFETEIAFEYIPKNEHVNIPSKLSETDISSINDAMMFSEIRARSIDPKEFNVDLEDK